MVWRSHLNRRNRRWGCRWSRRNGWRRRNIEWNCRPKESIQLILARLPRLLGVRRRRHFLDLVVSVAGDVLIG
jgi:hypothetical protein